MGKRIEAITNVVLLLTCLLISSLVTIRFVESRTPKPASGYSTGERIDRIPGLDYSSGSATVLLYVRSTCHFCTESMPFYRTLAKGDALGSRRARFVAVSSENTDVTSDYLRNHGLSLDQVLKYSDPHVRGTPTLLILDGGGKVIAQWIGRLDASQEAKVLDKLRTAVSSSVASR